MWLFITLPDQTDSFQKTPAGGTKDHLVHRRVSTASV